MVPPESLVLLVEAAVRRSTDLKIFAPQRLSSLDLQHTTYTRILQTHFATVIGIYSMKVTFTSFPKIKTEFLDRLLSLVEYFKQTAKVINYVLVLRSNT